jgi:hypothetical protein
MPKPEIMQHARKIQKPIQADMGSLLYIDLKGQTLSVVLIMA